MTFDRFTCEQAFARLDDYLDRELSAGEMQRVREHLDTCAVCASEYRFEMTVLADVRGKLARIDVPTGLRERISARLAGAQVPPASGA